jgi:glycogen synthase
VPLLYAKRTQSRVVDAATWEGWRCRLVARKWVARFLRPNGTATGFVFNEPTAESRWEAIEVALATWPDRVVWGQLIRDGMKADWSWKQSAAE